MRLVKRRHVVITHLLYLVGAAVRVVGVCSTDKELVRREPLDDPDVVMTVHLHEHNKDSVNACALQQLKYCRINLGCVCLLSKTPSFLKGTILLCNISVRPVCCVTSH